jgi:hypothetical protein
VLPNMPPCVCQVKLNTNWEDFGGNWDLVGSRSLSWYRSPPPGTGSHVVGSGPCHWNDTKPRNITLNAISQTQNQTLIPNTQIKP